MKPQNLDLTVQRAPPQVPECFLLNEKDLHGGTGKEAIMLFLLEELRNSIETPVVRTFG